jgi:hypothetical protein
MFTLSWTAMNMQILTMLCELQRNVRTTGNGYVSSDHIRASRFGSFIISSFIADLAIVAKHLSGQKP